MNAILDSKNTNRVSWWAQVSEQGSNPESGHGNKLSGKGLWCWFRAVSILKTSFGFAYNRRY